MILSKVCRPLAPAERECDRDDPEEDIDENKSAGETNNKHEQYLTHRARLFGFFRQPECDNAYCDDGNQTHDNQHLSALRPHACMIEVCVAEQGHWK